MKKYFILAALCALGCAFMLSLPALVTKAVPAAKNVEVQKITHTDLLCITGNIAKNPHTGETFVNACAEEKDISKIKKGQAAEITGDAFPDRVYRGIVSYIADSATSKQTGNTLKTVIEVRITITDPDSALKNGCTAKAALKTSETKVMTVVPYEAVDQDELGEYVFLLQNGVPVRRHITTGRELSEGFEVVSGLQDSDRVITIEDRNAEGKAVLIE